MGVGIRWGGGGGLGGRRDAAKEGEEEERWTDGGMNTDRERLVEGQTKRGTER